MAKIEAGKASGTETAAAPLVLRVDLTFHLEQPIWPSTVISTDIEDLTALEVLTLLDDEYGLDKGSGILAFLYDQSWVDVALTMGSVEILP